MRVGSLLSSRRSGLQRPYEEMSLLRAVQSKQKPDCQGLASRWKGREDLDSTNGSYSSIVATIEPSALPDSRASAWPRSTSCKRHTSIDTWQAGRLRSQPRPPTSFAFTFTLGLLTFTYELAHASGRSPHPHPGHP